MIYHLPKDAWKNYCISGASRDDTHGNQHETWWTIGNDPLYCIVVRNRAHGVEIDTQTDHVKISWVKEQNELYFITVKR